MAPVPDPHLDAATGILRNLVGAVTSAELAAFESDLTAARMVEIQADGLVAPTRDLVEVRSLHRHLFQDIFDWAGQLRTIDMKRAGGHFFAPRVYIEVNALHVFDRLRENRMLHDLARDEFVRRLAVFYDDLNFIHPFRDGNGRAQRLFWSRVAHDAGWLLDWRPIHGAELDEVSRAAREDRDFTGLEASLARCVRPLS